MYIAYTLGGILVGLLLQHAFVVRPLVNDIRTMRFKGFVSELPMPVRPKKKEVSMPNEALY